MLGPSGCGKSTLLNLAAGLTAPTQGQVIYGGRPVTALNPNVAYMTQADHLLPWRSVASNIAVPMEIAGIPRAERRERIERLLALVGLADFPQSYPSQLSGGMRKRAALARLLAADRETLLLDEPFGALDAQLRLTLQAELLKICRELNKTVLFVTHDIEEAAALADVCVMFQGRPGTIAGVIDNPLPKQRDLKSAAEAARSDAPALRSAAPRLHQRALGHVDLRARRRQHRCGGDVWGATAMISTNRTVLVGARLLLLAVLLLLWQFGSTLGHFDFYVSTPGAIGASFWSLLRSGDFAFHAGITTAEALLGFVIGGSCGVVVGLALGRSAFLADVLDPFLTAFYSLPKVALAPLFVLWFGIGIEMKIILAAVTVFFLVFLNTYTGVRNVSHEQLLVIRLMGANERHLLTKVVVPSAITWVFAGLRLSVPYALIGAVVGEIIASNRGLGFLVSDAAAKFDTAGVFAALLGIVALAMLLNFAVKQAETRLMPWKTADELREATV
nr:ABC transporter permease subunit [Bradyrhizobium tropiciagri]